MAAMSFVAEGEKVVNELLHVLTPSLIVRTEGCKVPTPSTAESTEVITVSDEELRRVSFLQHPQGVLAVFPMFGNNNSPIDEKQLYLALDGVQDPGNMGTIIRIADWFGIKRIICSHDTADIYNPKVVQATMGSIVRVRVEYTDLAQFIGSLPKDFPVYGTLLDGNNIYRERLSANGLIVMGNEGNGISPALRRLITHRLFIPSYPEGSPTAESLNVATATAIVCAEFRRRNQ